MQRFYSPSTLGFYNTELHGREIPEDSVEIDVQTYETLKEWRQSNKTPKLTDTGQWIAIDPPAPSESDVAAYLRNERDKLIESTDWLVQRHRDEKDMNRPTTMSAEAFAELLEYRQTLRDFPVAEGFPNLELPALPEGIAEMLESR